MNKNLEMVKDFLQGMNKLGMRVVTLDIATKDLLVKTRKHLKDIGFTEAKLVYRNGAYVMTVITEQVDHLGLALGGFTKLTKQEKELVESLYKPRVKEEKVA